VVIELTVLAKPEYFNVKISRIAGGPWETQEETG
jgi:hypothetical protein